MWISNRFDRTVVVLRFESSGWNWGKGGEEGLTGLEESGVLDGEFATRPLKRKREDAFPATFVYIDSYHRASLLRAKTGRAASSRTRPVNGPISRWACSCGLQNRVTGKGNSFVI